MSARAALALCAALAAYAPSFAQEDAGTQPYDAAAMLTLEVGETRSLGPGKVPPLRCDDPSLVEAVFADGLALRGLRPGTTLCSVYTAASTYLSYRVRVLKPAPPPPR